jgi:hypothetical protein
VLEVELCRCVLRNEVPSRLSAIRLRNEPGLSHRSGTYPGRLSAAECRSLGRHTPQVIDRACVKCFTFVEPDCRRSADAFPDHVSRRASRCREESRHGSVETLGEDRFLWSRLAAQVLRRRAASKTQRVSRFSSPFVGHFGPRTRLTARATFKEPVPCGSRP